MNNDKARILMCPPDHFSIEYEINAWMDRNHNVDHSRAVRQWQTLHAALVDFGAEVTLLEPLEGFPDFVFTANAGMVFGDRFISSRFRYSQRVGESPYFERWFKEAGFQIETLPEDMNFEGAGDALFCGSTLFGGYGFRTSFHAHRHIANLIQREVLPLQLVDERFYHLDTCFCPLAPDLALWYPAAFDSYAQDVVRSRVPDLIEAPQEEALKLACNAVVVDRSVALPGPAPRMRAELEARGFRTVELELDEFLKAGGSAKCLTLRVDGEEAAIWTEGQAELAAS